MPELQTATTTTDADFLKTKTGMLSDFEGEAPPTLEVSDEASTTVEPSLQEQLELHDQLNSDPVTTEIEAAPAVTEDGTPDWTSEKVIQLNKDFKEATGVDLKEGFELFAELRAELTAIKEAKQTDNLQLASTKLQEAWGVNDAEVQRRATEVAAYVSKLPEQMQQAVDNVDGIQLVWQHLQSSKANRQPQGKSAPQLDGNVQSYSRKQVSEWMRNDPVTYDKHAAGIAAARAAGRLTD